MFSGRRMEFRILGPLEIRVGNRNVAIPGGKQRALVALLVLSRGQAVSTDKLVDELWGESPPPTAAKIVQNYVSQLRKTLGADVVETQGHAYVLRREVTTTDAERFEQLLAAAQGSEPAAAARTLRAALGLWRGSVLSDVPFEGAARTEVARLEGRRLLALEQRIDADLALGRHADVIAELEALVTEHPLEERLRAQLMLALYRAGRQADALHAFRQGRTLLAAELGLEPGSALRELERKILQHDPALAPPAPPLVRRVAQRPWRLVAVGIGFVAAAAAFAGFELATDHHGSLSGVAAGAVGLIDPKTRMVSTFGTGGTPTDLAAGAGALWVANGTRLNDVQFAGPVATSVSDVDPRTHAVRAVVRLPRGRGEVSNAVQDHLAVDGRGLWVINPDYSVSRLDPRTDAVVATVHTVDAIAIAAGAGGTWVLNTDGTVARIDGRSRRRIRIAATALTDIAVGDGSVWLTDPYDGTLWRVDSRPRVVMRTIDVGAGADRVAFGEGSVWVANGLHGTVTRVDPQTNRVTATVQTGNTPRDVAAGAGGVWVTVAGSGGGSVPAAAEAEAAAETLPASFCGELFAGEKPDLLVASDLPLQGGNRFTTLQMSEAIGFVIRQRGFRAGRFRVGYQSCDDSTSQTGIFDPGKCAANAKAYGELASVVGIVGPYNSGCAFEEIPIANRVSLAVVSPSASVVGLTHSGPLSPRRGLARLYPTGRRNFVRVYSSDDYQAAAHALLAQRLGAKRVFVLHDGDEAFGLPRALAFRRTARKLGISVVGFRAWDPRARRYDRLAATVAAARPAAVFLGGGLYSNGGAVVSALRGRLATASILAPEFLPVSDLYKAAGARAAGTYVSVIGLTLDDLPAAGRRFVREFAVTQPGGRVDVSAVYAAQATEVLLAAIARSDGTRRSVTTELLRTRMRRGLVGTFRITATGDLSRNPITILRAVRGGGRDVVQGHEGAVVEAVIVPPRSLVR